jgi:hypothetical protein
MMKKYVFEGYISTMSFSQSGTVTGYGNTEQEARDNAIREVCRVHRIPADCVKIKKVVSVE